MLRTPLQLRFFEPPKYANFDAYTDIKPMDENGEMFGHDRFTAREKINRQSDTDNYEDKCYLLMREGVFRAQIEKAMSEIYQYFLGYGTDIDILKQGGDYYVSSRSIKYFQTWDECRSKNCVHLMEDGSLVYIEDDGTKVPIIGLGQLFVLTRFFADTDSHGGNFGLQKHGNVYRAFKIDNEKSFEFEHQKETGCDFEDDFAAEFNKDITQMDWYKKEKQMMLEKIANTDFSMIVFIIRKHITSNQIESARWLFQHMMRSLTDEDDKAEMKVALEALDKEDPEKYGVDSIVNELKVRHDTLCSQYVQRPKMVA